MSKDHFSETIAHFIGLFHLNAEAARQRIEYETFAAARKADPDPGDLPHVRIAIPVDHALAGADPRLRHEPAAEPAPAATPLQPPTGAPKAATPFADGSGGHGTGLGAADNSITIGGAGDPPGGLPPGVAPPPPVVGTPKPTPLPVPPPIIKLIEPGSTAVVVHQTAILLDRDWLDGHDAGAAFVPLTALDARLEALREAAAGLAPAHALAPPEDGRELADYVAAMTDFARTDPTLAWSDSSSPNPSSSDAVPTFFLGPSGDDANMPHVDGTATAATLTGDVARDRHVDGKPADALPAFRDALPERLEPPKPFDPETAEEVSLRDPVPPHQAEIGGNTLINQAVLTSSWTTAPVFAVFGDARLVDVIVQANVWSDFDRIFGPGEAGATIVQGGTEAVNAAALLEQARPGWGGGQPGAPDLLALAHRAGDVVNLAWAKQSSFVLDHDIVTLSLSGNETWIGTGGNAVSNSFFHQAFGHGYDLVIVGGDLVSATVIVQSNILLDDDEVHLEHGFSGSVKTGGNLLWNEASITSLGVSAHHAMPQGFVKVAEALAAGALPDPADWPAEMLLGGDLLRVLYVEGSVYDIQYIHQMNVLGDADQVSVAAARAGAASAETELKLATGANALANIASVTKLGVDAKIYAAGAKYSDALLHQAAFVASGPEDPAGLVTGDARVLAGEAFAFLADHLLQDAASKVATAHADSSGTLATAATPDLLQTMLS